MNNEASDAVMAEIQEYCNLHLVPPNTLNIGTLHSQQLFLESFFGSLKIESWQIILQIISGTSSNYLGVCYEQIHQEITTNCSNNNEPASRSRYEKL